MNPGSRRNAVHVTPVEPASRRNPTVLPSSSWEVLERCTSSSCERSWSELVRSAGPQLARSVRKLLRRDTEFPDPGLVEDLVQEVYCRLLAGQSRPERRFRGRSEAEATAYLHRVATNVVLDSRRDAHAGKRGGGSGDVRIDGGGRIVELLPAPPELDADARSRELEWRSAFRIRCGRVLGRRAVPSTLRIAELALLDGWSSREIAARSGGRLRASGVNSVIYRLRRRFARDGVVLPRRQRRSGGGRGQGGRLRPIRRPVARSVGAAASAARDA